MELSALYEAASRGKWRFSTPKGLVTVEDLWDLPIMGDSGCSLNDAAIMLNDEIKSIDSDEGVLDLAIEMRDNKRLQVLRSQLNLVKHIAQIKLRDQLAAEKAAATRLKRNKIREIIAAKEDASLNDMSIEDLKSLLEDE